LPSTNTQALSSDDNYERLQVYTNSDEDRRAVGQAAAALVASEATGGGAACLGGVPVPEHLELSRLSFLRLYFLQVIWPQAQEQVKAVEAAGGGLSVLRFDDVADRGMPSADAMASAAMTFLAGI
jgi:hypothetical protein